MLGGKRDRKSLLGGGCTFLVINGNINDHLCLIRENTRTHWQLLRQKKGVVALGNKLSQPNKNENLGILSNGEIFKGLRSNRELCLGTAWTLRFQYQVLTCPYWNALNVHQKFINCNNLVKCLAGERMFRDRVWSKIWGNKAVLKTSQ